MITSRNYVITSFELQQEHFEVALEQKDSLSWQVCKIHFNTPFKLRARGKGLLFFAP
jgi:hypothetical protein